MGVMEGVMAGMEGQGIKAMGRRGGFGGCTGGLEGGLVLWK